MPVERKVPPPDELTPSEIVFLFGDQFAPIHVETGFSARVDAEWDFFSFYGILIMICGMVSLGAVAVLMKEGHSWIKSAFLGILAVAGIAGFFGAWWGYFKARRKATAADFAHGSIRLLDPNRVADGNELATRIVAAAILANEKAGAITVRETENGIVLTPAAVIPWPRGTIEGRIIGESAGSVSDLVYHWLQSDSRNPFERVMNITRIGAFVHGYIGEPETFYASLSPAPVKTLFESCRFLTRLLGEVHDGISRRTHHFTATSYQQLPNGGAIPHDDFQEQSPWSLEAAIDRETEPTISVEAAASSSGEDTAPSFGDNVAMSCGLLFVVALLGGFVFLTYEWVKGPHPNSNVIPEVLVVVSVLLSAVFVPRRRKNETIAQVILASIMLGEIASLLVGVAVGNPFFAPFVAVFVVLGVLGALHQYAKQRIEKRVLEIDQSQQTSTQEQPATIVPSRGVPAPPLTIIDPHTLPEASADVPFPQPPRLLMLRVFGSPAITDLLELTRPWEEFGVILHLAGPGTVAENFADIFNFATGRVDASITENDQELDEAYARIKVRKKGRDSIQCTGATWKKAVDRMLADASVVLMDLSSMSREHQGCAYELGLLLNRLPLGRVTLLVNDDSDLDCLREILDQAWLQMHEESPNRNASGLTWNAIRVGGMSARQRNENAYEWERRVRHRLQPSQLVGFLKNSAMSLLTVH